MSIRSTFRFSGLLSMALLLAGCNLFESGGKKSSPEGVSGLTSSWIGQPLDSIADAHALAFREGRLYVTNRNALQPGTAVVDAATGLVVEYYPHLLQPASLAFTASGKLIVTEGSFGAEGAVSVVDPSTRRIVQSVIAFDQDNKAVSADGVTYLFDRTQGVITGFTGDMPGENVVLDVQTGANSNPYGIAFAGGKAFVPRYNQSSLLILGSPGTLNGGARDSIDLSAYAHDSANGVPRMSLVATHGNHVFVAMQRLNHQWVANDTALVIVFDATTKAVVDTIPLTFRNPVSGAVLDGVWYLGGVAGYGDLLGGVEKINLATRTHGGTVVTEETLGGDLSTFTPAGTGGYAIISVGAWPNTKNLVKKVD